MTEHPTVPTEARGRIPTTADDAAPEDGMLGRRRCRDTVARQLQLIWLRFVRNRAALVGGAVVLTVYLLAAVRRLRRPVRRRPALRCGHHTPAPADLPGGRRPDLPARARPEDRRPTRDAAAAPTSPTRHRRSRSSFFVHGTSRTPVRFHPERRPPVGRRSAKTWACFLLGHRPPGARSVLAAC